MKQIEAKIQSSCVRWFRLQYPRIAKLLFHVGNGGHRDIKEASFLKKEGVTAGVADLILLVPNAYYHSLCIEMKTPAKTSRQSEFQKEWQVMAEKTGNKYIICRSIGDFIHEVNSYLRDSKEIDNF